MEKELKSKLLKIVQFGLPHEQGHEGHELEAADRLLHLFEIRKEREDLLLEMQEKRRKLVSSTYEEAAELFQRLGEISQNSILEERVECDRLKTESLKSSVGVIGGVIRKIQLEITRGTYLIPHHAPLKGLDALRSAKSALDSTDLEITDRIERNQEALEGYESLGEGFTELCREYKKVCARIEEVNEWIRTVR